MQNSTGGVERVGRSSVLINEQAGQQGPTCRLLEQPHKPAPINRYVRQSLMNYVVSQGPRLILLLAAISSQLGTSTGSLAQS